MTISEFFKELQTKVKPELIEGHDTIFHFILEGSGEYTLYLRNNQLIVEEGLCDEPKCVVKATTENFMDVVTGKSNPMMAVMTGKLKISNPGEMIKYAKVFGLM